MISKSIETKGKDACINIMHILQTVISSMIPDFLFAVLFILAKQLILTVY